jgi:cysteine synthase
MTLLSRLTSKCRELGLCIGDTPRLQYELAVGELRHEIYFKLERFNSFGSLKDRVALAVIEPLLACGGRSHNLRVLDASSGNYGVALAGLGQRLGFGVTIVAPTKISDYNREAIARSGAELIIRDRDYTEYAQELHHHRDAVYLDQYNNPANPGVHADWTAPETLAGLPRVDAVFVAASSGGTARGFRQYLRTFAPETKLVVADSPRSAVLAPASDSGAPPKIPGLGSSRKCTFEFSHTPEMVRVAEDVVFRARAVALGEGVLPPIGLSSFGVLCGALVWLQKQAEPRSVVLVCADGAEKYTAEADRFAAEHPGPFQLPPEIDQALRTTRPAVQSEKRYAIDAAR